MKKYIVIAVLAFVWSVPASAQMKKTQPAPDPNKVAVLKKIREQGKNLEYAYLGRRFGMDAWVISGPGVMQVLYTAPDGVAAVVGGVLVGPDGQEVSTAMQREFTQKYPARAQKMLEAARSKPAEAVAQNAATGDKAASPPAADEKPISRSEQIWTRLGGLGLVTAASPDVTKPVPVVYAILDPSQADSKTVWDKLSALADRGLIVVHAVPLATQTADQLLDIAHVLGGGDDRRALWDGLLAGTKPAAPQTVDPKGAVGLNDNVTFAQELKIFAVPFLLYRVPATASSWGPVRAVKGMPKDWSVILSDLGVPKE